MEAPVKILVFAHVPPPHHGQSAMVKLMLDGLRSGEYGDFEIHHVDARFSDNMEEIGRSGLNKVLRACKFSIAAIRIRFKHGVKDLYYVPAPPKKGAMVRDWIVMAMCRPFFPKVTFHWHAVGLGEWTKGAKKSGNLKMRIAAWLNRKLLGGHFRSMVLTEWGRDDVVPFEPRLVSVVPNGIQDPCEDFDEKLLGKRIERREELNAALSGNGECQVFRVCYLGHCCEEKGLWDAMEAVAIANTGLAEKDSLLRITLRVAGEFPTPTDSVKFANLALELAVKHGLPDDWLAHVGFVDGLSKRCFLEESDCLCFPTRYRAESFGLVAAEALAFGIPPVTSDWRMLPGLMGAIGLPVAVAGDPRSLSDGIIAAVGRDDPHTLRGHFLEHFNKSAHLRALSDALRGNQDTPKTEA